MKAISVLQPWATLIGIKMIETRSRYTSYRGELAIHASKSRSMWRVVHHEPFRSVLLQKNIIDPNDLTYGAVISIANLYNCLQIQADGLYSRFNNRKVCDLPPEPERSFGDYTPGRWALMLKDVRPLPGPVPAKGQLGIWNWDPPEGVLIS